MTKTIHQIKTGDRVQGLYLGVPYVGRVDAQRPHTMNHQIQCFSVTLESPIEVFGDVRDNLWVETADCAAAAARYHGHCGEVTSIAAA